MKRISERILHTMLQKDKITLEDNISVTNTATKRIFNFFNKSKKLKSFTGVLDGNGYCIENPPVGLFEKIKSEGVIKNITIKFTNRTLSDSSKAILCEKNEGEIENITIKDQQDTSRDISGGITKINNGSITDCSVNISLIHPKQQTGGITQVNNGIIENSKFNGTIEANSSGGIAAVNNGTVKDCSVRESCIDARLRSGCIVGKNNRTISKCNVSNTEILNQSSHAESKKIGGICGENLGTIKRCGVKESTRIKGGVSIGGVCGSNKQNIEECVTSAESKVGGRTQVGGITGVTRYRSKIQKTISRSTDITADKNIGGITGAIERKAEVTNSVSKANVKHGKRLGLLFGLIDDTDDTLIEDCYYYGNHRRHINLIGSPDRANQSYQNSISYNAELSEENILSILTLKDI